MQPSRISSGRTGEDRASVRLAIADAAQRTGASFSYLLNQAKSESGLNPNAKAGTSSATGLYQFIDQSWLGILKQHGTEHGYGWAADAIHAKRGGGFSVSDPEARQAIFALRRDPTASALMAGEYAQDNAAGLTSALGREVTATDLYFGHFLGLAGAKKFLKAAAAAPDASAASLFPREAAANHGLFYTKGGAPRSFAQLYALMGRKIDGPAESAPTGNDALTRPIQMASLAATISPTTTPLSDTPPSDVRLVDLPASIAAQAPSETMLALNARGDGGSLLRPNPKNAMLAYLMVLSPGRG